MARMFGLIGNRSHLAARVLELQRAVLCIPNASGQPMGWGIGFYQAGEVLLRLRPTEHSQEVDLAAAAGPLRTDIAIGHTRGLEGGALTAENTQPFRYRLWLFAQTGRIAAFDRLEERLLESQPEFLRRNVRGDTDAELFFYLLLSFLHDAGQLGTERVPPAQIRAALRAAIALVDRLSAEEGCGPNRGDILVSDGDSLLAVHRGGNMGLRVYQGPKDLDELLGADPDRGRVPNAERIREALVVTSLDGMPSGWTPVPDRTIVTLNRDDLPLFEPL